jgi:hypothetical protein
MLRDGAVFSCYWEQGSSQTLVLEDVLAYKGQALWQSMTFAERWQTMRDICKELQPDTVLQGFDLRMADYVSMDQLPTPTDREVFEFVPNAANSKRLIWLPVEEVNGDSVAKTAMIAKRETIVGPDIFSLWQNNARVGMAIVRTLAVSKALRQKSGEEFEVQTCWNKMFERHEIVGV